MTTRTAGLLESPTLEYLVVDVFVGPQERPFAGNPLAVVLGGDALTTAQCQALAVEFHLSETVFPIAPTEPGADYRARIFTPSSELPFAGHPSVGVAWVLQRLGRIGPGLVTQECGVGLVTLELPAEAGPITLTGPVPAVSDPLDAGPLLAAVGLGDDALAGPAPRSSGTGIGFAFLCVRPEALSAVRPDLSALAGIGPDLTGVVVFALEEPDPSGALRIRARMFAADIGGEDPATGSAALALGGWLVATGIAAEDGETNYTIAQGVEMGRPSQLECVVTATAGAVARVRVAGHVVPIANGRIRVPEAF